MPVTNRPTPGTPTAPTARPADGADATTATTAADAPAPSTDAPAPDASASFDGTSTATPDAPVGHGPAPDGATSPLLARLAGLGISPPAGGLPPGAQALLMGLPDLSTPDGQQALAQRLEHLMGAAAADPAMRAELEQQLIGAMVQLSASGQLEPVLMQLAGLAAEAGALPDGISDEKKQELVGQLAGMVQAELTSRGLIPGATTQPFEPWDKLSARLLEQVRDTAVAPAGPGTTSALRDPAFIAELEQLQGAKFSSGNSIKPLIDGPASFAARDKLIDEAETSIHLMSWAFYDDHTGRETADKLIKKAAEGVEVRVIVDGQVAARSAHDDVIKHLEDNGVEVVRWRNPERPFDGQHRKVMVVDGHTAIAGGINVGDHYSHRGPADGHKWRDTDVLVEGRGARDSELLFAQVWNEQVQTHSLAFDAVETPTDPAGAGVGDAKVAVVNHTPGDDAHILLSTLKAIEGATESVDITNAYFIETPAIKDALLAALERGVNVRILTNSAESVDEPIVTAPILASLPDLADAGAEIYLKTGDTLHAKSMVVDGFFSSVGSYNLHPRSHRYEGEMMMNALDEDLAGGLTEAFDRDAAAATRVNTGADVEIPKSAFTMIASRYFFDQL
jgi:cardiolipin synthase